MCGEILVLVNSGHSVKEKLPHALIIFFSTLKGLDKMIIFEKKKQLKYYLLGLLGDLLISNSFATNIGQTQEWMYKP